MVSTFRNALDFFDKLGIYDVILPFLLTFTLVFAILEKTKVFGVEKFTGDDEPRTKKNINSMVAFVVAFFVVASSRLVAVISETLSNMVLLLMLSVTFLILIGSFYTGKDIDEMGGAFGIEGGMRTAGIAVMLIGLVLIFLNALGWLTIIWDYLQDNWNSSVVGSIILLIIILGAMVWIASDKKPAKSEE